MLPEPEEYAAFFHDSYREHPEAIKKRMEWKKMKKKSKSRSKQKNRVEMLCEHYHLPPEIDLPTNASAFASFASIRLAVLDKWMKQASQEYLQSSCSAPLQDQSEVESDTEENTQSSAYMPLKESRISHPILCTKALSALLDVLQGQSPEGLKSEPMDIIDPLFDLLLDLATLHGPESSVPNDGTHLTAIACACLLSLVVVRGDTGKYLSAAAALLMCPRALSMQNVQMPSVLAALQRSVHGVLHGKIQRPDWITHGIPASSKTNSFFLQTMNEIQNMQLNPKSLAMDGLYLYLFTSKGLFKIGSGYGGTLKGHVYLWKPDFYPNDNGSLVFCAGKLYLKLCGRRGVEFLIVERTDLLISAAVPLHSRDAVSSVVFSDGDCLGTISPAKDDGFVIRILNQNTVPASLVSELPLKLARNDEEIASICAGKEFGLIRTLSGKVLYCGKASALGIKQSGIRSSKWSELVLTKAPKITHISVGHDGLHAVILTEDGSAFFTGTARRGEDGDQSKVRRQPKSMKPKKIIKVDGQFIVSSACNNGTTALVTRDGELLMFGKDTAHSDPSTGIVYSLKGEFIAQVALGKAHALALTSKGQIFTFGINNKYQCGREFVPVNKEGDSFSGTLSNVLAMDTGVTQDDQDTYEEMDENRKEGENQPGGSEGNNMEPQLNMCPPGMHSWHDERCMICTICGECTGYSISCLSSISARNPGRECGCGEGDSGCSICGCCRICAREVVDNSELADLAGMMRLDFISLTPPRKAQDQIQSRLEERKIKTRKSGAGPSKQNSKIKIARQSASTSSNHRANNLIRQTNISGSSTKEQINSDVERDATRIACLPPAKIQMPCDSPVVQIACGQHHSVVLCQNGQVYSFGSNLYGQLGCGDILAKNSIQLVKLPCSAVHIAAGNNHTVILTSKGEVFTFGNHQKGQLGRSPPSSQHDASQPGQSSSSKYVTPRTPWYSLPATVPNIGPRHGRRATWVGASGDQTFVKIDESLINSVSISKSTVTANKHSLVLIPNYEESAKSFSCLVINKRDGNCNSFKAKDQMSFCGKAICLDPIYNVLWSYNPQNHEIECFNIISSELTSKNSNKLEMRQLSNPTKTIDNSKDKNFNITSVLSPELALPLVTNCYVTRFQAAINLLCCLDTLTVAHDLQMAAVKEEIDDRQMVTGKQYCKEDYQVVNRFESHGGGWGYSGHSIEAIRFMADTDILLGGFGLFGGRGEYTAKMKLLDIGPDGGDQEGDGEILAETEELPYECGPRQKCSMLFDEPIPLQAHRWYVAWCRISGPSSDCGSSGQTMVTSEDQVIFYFKSSKKSNNGTDVNAGQIPQLLYKVITPESQAPSRQTEIAEPVHILSKDFSRSVTKECFQSLLSLLQWSWNTFKWGVVEGQNIKNVYTYLELERLVYISKASLRLIRTYTNEIYPSQINKKVLLENVHLAESIGDVRSLLKQILSDNLPLSYPVKKSGRMKNINSNSDLIDDILEECHNTFVACFHAFYPTAYLKWTSLCDLLSEIDKEGNQQSSSNSQRLLSAVLCALCAPNVRLRSTFPLLGSNISADSSLHRGLSPSDNTGLPMMSGLDSHHYPILVEQMSYKSQMESSCSGLSFQWKEVLDKLLFLVADPIMLSLQQSKVFPLPGLTKHCCHLLARVVAELVHQCNATEEELQSGCGRILHMTPSRFTRTNQSRTWNTGNGSPDAICFQVDSPGISIAGVGVYGGIGHYEYEVELLEDQSVSISGSDNHAHTQRWNSLEVTRGSFGPEDFAPDIIEIKFDRAVPIKENMKYAIRLRNHGGRTNNGDGGLNSVKGSDGTNFIFSTCALSFNGTTLTRGQVPVLLYYSNPIEYGKASTTKLEHQARKAALSMTSAIIRKACSLMTLAREKAEEIPSSEFLSGSCMVTTLLPLVVAHISSLATSDPRSAVYVLGLIYELLPHVAALNLIAGSTPTTAKSVSSVSGNTEGFDYRINTTSHHYTWVQSDHPYKPATISNYRVKFPDTVKWLSVEFDPACSTVQPEDTLQLYVPALGTQNGKTPDTNSIEIEDGESPPLPYWPVLHKFSGCLQGPSNAVVLPGNEVIFSLETASDYLKDDKASAYGFKCLVIGYEWPLPGSNMPLMGLKYLESELAFLGGMCAASLMKKDILLPTFGDEAHLDIEMAEVVASETFAMHSQLLSKGLALSNPPTVNQALDGMLPYR
ncbi:hypothetical protein WA026_014685 [Henosepilachna vigintioctopunctata]|uniref:PHR domain-containing protein n=1 Tax=Henosepilachna vigintioctopunctata TaxID=420089 RepID=A0AAW1VGW8_9CUCU